MDGEKDYLFSSLNLGESQGFQTCELNPSKARPFKNIPPKLLKSQSKLVSAPLQIIFNNTIEHSTFLDELKLADVSSLFKKEVKTFKGNYRPISVLPTVSKVLKGSWVLKFQHICLSIYHFYFADFVRAIVPNMH